MLLLVGPAMSGKSRTGAEALRAHPALKTRPLLIPQRRVNLRDLAPILRERPATVWLDNLDDYVAGLDSDLLHSWQETRGLVVLGTLRRDLLIALMDKPELH